MRTGDDEAAHDVRGGQDHRDEADPAGEQIGVGDPGDDHRATITIPWIAFVPDINGVCSRVGTFEITSIPRKIASAEDRQLDDELGVMAHVFSFRVTQAPR